MNRFGIKIVDVRIRRADLPEANSQAIYERMISERVREAKEFRAKGSEIAQKIRAEADKENSNPCGSCLDIRNFKGEENQSHFYIRQRF